jgi:hypothetical protein
MSALPLLVLGVSLADDPSDAVALDHLAVLANRLHAAPYFHVLLQVSSDVGFPDKLLSIDRIEG